MPLDRAWAEEELRADLRVRQSFRCELCDLRLLRGQLISCFVRALAGRLAGRSELTSCALREPGNAHLAEHVVRRTQVRAGVEPTALASHPLAVQEMGTCEVRTSPRTAEALDGFGVQRLGDVGVIGNKGCATGLQAKTPNPSTRAESGP
jgi:hypothetical protein